MKRLLRFGWLSIPLLACVAAAGCGPRSQAPPAPPPPEVEIGQALTQKVTDFEDFPGRTEAINSIELRARVSGYLDKINFTEGTDVEQGQVLFEIDPRTYKADLDQAVAQVHLSEAQLRYADAEYKRNLSLRPTGAVTPEELERSLSARDTAAASVRSAQATVERRKLDLAFTKVIAPLDPLGKKYLYRVSRRYIDPGNMVKADDTVLTTLVSLDQMYAYFDLDERTTLHLQELIREGKIHWIKNGDSVGRKLTVKLGLANEEGFSREGTVNFADNRVDPDTGTWRLRGLFDNSDCVLTPGLYVRMRLPLGDPHETTLVAEQALGTDQGQKFVYVVKDFIDPETKEKVLDPETKKPVFGMVERRRVKVGRVHNGLRVITGNLDSDEWVIVSGLQRVREGMKIKRKEVKMPVMTAPAAQTNPKSEIPKPKPETPPKDQKDKS